ncbi:MAG: hypothetical protein R3A10_06540 [Caldilineaceae bacterium]
MQTSYNTQLDLTGRIKICAPNTGSAKRANTAKPPYCVSCCVIIRGRILWMWGARRAQPGPIRGFMLRGWHGILVEPLPKVFTQLAYIYRNNPKATCLNLACTDRSGQQPLYVGTDGDIGMGSTLCEDDNEWFAACAATQRSRLGPKR